MQVFVAFNISDPSLVRSKLEQRYSGRYYYDDDRTFFIATEGETTRQLASNIGLGDEEPATSGIVMPVTTFWGRYNSEVWEWISVKLSANGK